MIDQTTADLEKLRLYAAYAKRIEKVIFDARYQLDKERETLVAQLDRAQDHVEVKPFPFKVSPPATEFASKNELNENV